MAGPIADQPLRMSREEFRRWAESQPEGRFERLDGLVIAMAPERGAHLRAKAAVYRALYRAVAATGAECQVLPDGATVEVDADTDYEPDAMVNCGPRMADDAIKAPNPVIVVEVVSPSSKSIDSGTKLRDYFRVPSIRHYLILLTDRRVAVHHWRLEDDRIETRIVAAGTIDFLPQGIALEVGSLFDD